MKKLKSSALRKGRVSIENQIYLITTVTNKRLPVFLDLYVGRELVKVLNSTASEVKTICFVIMPDHLHWLVQLKAKSKISKIVQKI